MSSQPLKPNRIPDENGHYICYKCKKNKAVVKTRERACKNCFLDSVQNIFKSNLKLNSSIFSTNSSINYESPSHLLVAVSGGISSTVALHLTYLNYKAFCLHRSRIQTLKKFKNKNNFQINNDHNETEEKNVFTENPKNKNFTPFTFSVLHVDSSYIWNNKYDQSISFDPIQDWVQTKYSNEIVYYKIPLGFSLLNPDSQLKYVDHVNFECNNELVSNLNEIKSILHQLVSQSSIACQELLKILVHRDIWTFTLKKKYSGVLLGDSAELLAQTAISMLCNGEGINIPLALSYEDHRYPNCAFLRPLKSFSNKEIYFYFYFNQLKEFPTSSSKIFSLINRGLPLHSEFLNLKTMLSSNKSVKPTSPEIISQFLENLNAEFPSTILNINHTCNKIVPINPLNDSIFIFEKCSLCLGNRDSHWDLLNNLEDLNEKNESLCSGCMRLLNSHPYILPIVDNMMESYEKIYIKQN